MLLGHADPSGVSGTVRVATGCEFGDGTVVLHWSGEHSSTTVRQSIASVIAVHGYQAAPDVAAEKKCSGADSPWGSSSPSPIH